MVERDPIDFGANLVAATLGMTNGGAQARVDTARAITETLPKCQLAMAAGHMGYGHARVVAQAVRDAGLDPAGIAAVDERVASKIKGQSWAAFRRTLRRAVLASNPDVVLAEHAAAMIHRGVDKFDLLDAVMSQLQFTMSSIDAQTVSLGLDATALQLQAAAKAARLPMRASTPTAPTRSWCGRTMRWATRTHPAGTAAANKSSSSPTSEPARAGR